MDDHTGSIVFSIRVVAVCALFAMILATVASAQTTTYTYSDTAYFYNGIASPPICPITGSITTPQPIPPNSKFYVVTTFAFTDCLTTITNVNNISGGVQTVDTNALGEIVACYFDLVIPQTVVVTPVGGTAVTSTVSFIGVWEGDGNDVPHFVEYFWGGVAPYAEANPGTWTTGSPVVSLSRDDLTQVVATGSPSGGAFSYSVKRLAGSSLAGIDFAAGVTSTTNPNTTNLSDPPNPTPKQSPSPGGLAQITASYETSTNATNSFEVPTFGMSCYYTELESDWGTPPDKCRKVKIKGVTYSGTVTNPYGYAGTYCSAFIAEVKLEGAGVLKSGQDIQYEPSNNTIYNVAAITGADGSALVANQTVARDKGPENGCSTKHYPIIPKTGVLVDIDQIGTGLLANDIGCDIVGYRLDLFRGAGAAVCKHFANPILVGACNPGNSNCPASEIQ